jgi:hypothetical protein
MHCRYCLCDILGNEPIGTAREFYLQKRREKRKTSPPKSILEIYNTA